MSKASTRIAGWQSYTCKGCDDHCVTYYQGLAEFELTIPGSCKGKTGKKPRSHPRVSTAHADDHEGRGKRQVRYEDTHARCKLCNHDVNVQFRADHLRYAHGKTMHDMDFKTYFEAIP